MTRNNDRFKYLLLTRSIRITVGKHYLRVYFMLTPALICTLVLIAINPNTHELDAVTVIGTKTQRTLKSQPGTITVKTSEALKRELAPDQGMFFIPVLEMAEAADGKVANHATKLKFVKALHVYLLNDKP